MVDGGRQRRRFTVSLVLTGRVADEVNGLRRALGAAEITRIVPHVTLVPTRNVCDEEVGSVSDLLRRVAAAAAPFCLQIGPVATFAPDNPVCYLAVSGDDHALGMLHRLHAGLNAGVLEPPAGRPERTYVPHVTINQNMDPLLIGDAVNLLGHYRAEVTCERITLLEHHETERQWVVLADYEFGPPRLVGRGGYEVELSCSDHLEPVAAAWSSDAWSQYANLTYPNASAYKDFAITARLAGAGEVLGTATGELRGHVCRLGRLMVGADQRGLGIGTKLILATESLGVANGCGSVRLEAMVGSRAERFYVGRGYVVVATLPRYWEEMDFVLMERQIS